MMAKNVRFKIKKICGGDRGREGVYYKKERKFSTNYVTYLSFHNIQTYIEDNITYFDELTTPVFQLRRLTELYKKHMILHGAATKDTNMFMQLD